MAGSLIQGQPLPRSDDALIRRIEAIERKQRELGPSIARSFGSTVAALTSAQSTLTAQQATLTAQQATLATTVSDLAIAQATLATTVSDLAIAQATLATTVAAMTASGSNKDVLVGSALTATRTNMVTATITVPSGFTKAQVWAFSDVSSNNTTASADYLLAGTKINAYEGGENSDSCQAGYSTTVSHTATTALTGLIAGNVISCIATARTGNAPWGANASNLVRIQAIALFSR